MAVIAGEAVTVHRLARDEARRIAVGAQLLDADRPSALVPMVERLTFLQIDPTAAIAPSADLVAWSRMGASYEPEDLRRALEEDRTLFEHNAMVRPMSDLGLYLADDDRAPRLRVCPRDVQARGEAAMELLRASDPPSRPPGRKARRHRRPQGRGAPRPRHSPGRALHAHHGRRHRVPRGVARPRGQAIGESRPIRRV